VIFAVDHVVLACSAGDRRRIAAGLERAGARREAFTLDFPDTGVTSDSWSLAGGEYLELLVEAPGRRGPATWFDAPTRVIGIGFSSDDFSADVAWPQEPGRWGMDEEHTLPDGRRHRIVAAGPHAHDSPFYVFVMDRPGRARDFPARPSGPCLRRITLVGRDAPALAHRLGGWLNRPVDGGTLRVGECEICAGDDPRPGVRATLTLRGDARIEIPMAAGEIEIEPR
jgi:hypothetical protein